MRRRALATAGALAAVLISTDLVTGSGAGAATADGMDRYVVIMRADPAAAFRGDAEFAATAPREGGRFRASTDAAVAYRTALLADQQRVRTSAGIEPSAVVYSYTTALDGFSAYLTTGQVKALQADSRVASIQPDRIAHVDGALTPAGDASDLGLDGAASAWRQLGGVERSGRGVVVGVIDTGIWPDHPSFAGVPLDRSERQRTYPGFSGSCDSGERWAPGDCTSKILSARYFVDGFGADNISSAEYLSARDSVGHGSQVAAIAAGNTGVDVTIDGQEFGHVSGVAPSAGLAIYKACWAAPDPSDDGCTTSDSVAAIDQATADGVDILNFSASTPGASIDDPVELAFLGAAAAGVFVATSAGDGGPTSGSAAHPSPWVATAAASTQATYQGGARLGSGRVFVGSMASDRTVPSTRLMYARRVAAPGWTPQQAAWCEPGSLSAAMVEDAIVLCDRGQIARVSKSAAVEQAGGVGMILANDRSGPVDIDVHDVPTVHVTRSDGHAIKAYLSRAAHPTAALHPRASTDAAEHRIAAFSGRGPADVPTGDILKPDLAAPGVAVVSAVAPSSDGGRLWDMASGTSMAAPHLAGEAALLLAAHPSWSAAAVKSAMMTTAGEPAGGAGAFKRGSGILRSARALDPGLVFDTGRQAWLSYLRGLGSALPAASEDLPPLAADDLNQPTIAIGSLVGEQTVTRQVTQVAGARETYTLREPKLRGIAVRVDPPTLTLSPGASARYDVTFTARRGARYGEYAQGELIWTGSLGHRVSSPVVVRPEPIAPPAELTFSGGDGRGVVSGNAGVTGVVIARTVGPVAAQPAALTIPVGGFDPADPDDTASVVRTYSIPPGTAVARFEVDAGFADADLFVYRDDRLVAAEAGPSGVERVTLERPPAGTYTIYVVATASSNQASDADQVQVAYTGWVVPNRSASGLEVERRTKVTGGASASIPLSWSNLSDAHRWFGEVRYRDSSGITHVTIN